MASEKFYRVKKDTFLWHEGAVLQRNDQGDDGGYSPISDLWNTEANDEVNEYISASNIENNPEWFERVYEASKFGKLVYVSKEQAKKVAGQFFAGKEHATDKE